MKKTLIALMALWLYGSIAVSPPSAQALCDGGLTGPKIAGNMDDGWLRAIRQEYNKANPGCQNQEIPVTILLQKGAITGRTHTLATMKSLNLKPTIRLASSGSSTGWARITPTEAQQMAADVSQIISQAGIINPIVYFGNEPNLDAEWGGTADSISFARSFDAFIQAAGSSRSFQIFLPPMATHQAELPFKFMTEVLNRPLSGTETKIGAVIDGAALTLYNDSPTSINVLYQQLRKFYNDGLEHVDLGLDPKKDENRWVFETGWGLNNFFVSEVGPRVGGELLQKICQLRQWKSKMTEFFQNQPITSVQGINTSFFADLDCDGDPDYTYLVVIDAGGEVEVYIPYNEAGDADPLEKWYADKGRADELDPNNCCVAAHEGVTTISGASVVCADFTVSRDTTTETGGTPTPTRTLSPNVRGVTQSLGEIGGQIILEESQFPDFSRFQEVVTQALPRLLPGQLGRNISLPGETKIPLIHFIQGKGDGATGTGRGNSPASEVKVPANLWGRLVGAVRGFCGFLGVGICQPVSNFQFELASAEAPEKSACPAGQAVKPADLPAPTTKQADFSIRGMIERITEIIGDLTRTTEKTAAQVSSAGSLPGEIQNFKFLEGFLPASVNQTIAGGGALSEPFRYDVALSPGEDQIESGQYLGLGPVRAAYCLSVRCANLPTEIDVSSVDPICPSCNPEYYISLDDVPLDTSLCHDDGAGACDYYLCDESRGDVDCLANHQGCGPNQDPVCESERCNPYEWGQRKDYDSCPAGPPYGEFPCNAYCKKQHFNKNDDGGYGHCRYTTEWVCVRPDRVDTGNCAAVCNPACCPN